MAYSPTPHLSALQNLAAGTFNSRYRLNQPSPSPPPPPQQNMNMNKRDKKRQAIADRLTEISNNFAENRDGFYRDRLRSFQGDITFINNARLYDNEALDDSNERRGEDQNVGAAGNAQGGSRTQPNARMPPAPSLGKHAAMFVQEVNDALEEKDAQLVRLADNYNFTVDRLKKDYEFQISVAEEESKRLMDTLRHRLIANVQAKKATLQRDKEKLDIADTNALLYHPNQFSINNGASPGGPQGNRKTRHTRHRLEIDDLEAAAAINGKRKRRGAAEGDNGSPIRDSEPVNGYRVYEPRQEDLSTPTYTIDKLFSDKDLNSHLQLASLKVLEEQQASKRRKLDGASAFPTADLSDPDDNGDGDPGDDGDIANGDMLLEAPAMERGGTNQSYHATRSTRTLNLINGATRENLGELAGRQAAAELIGTYHREKKKEDDYNRAPPLSNEGVEHDFALMAKAMKAEDQRRPSDASLLDDVAGERIDYVIRNMPQINGEERTRDDTIQAADR